MRKEDDIITFFVQDNGVGIDAKCHQIIVALNYLHGRDRYADRTLFPLPHLMLLDLRLPKVDGLDVLREVKGTTPQPPP